MIFSSQEWLRYTRHIQLGQFGAEGQSILKDSHVLIVGCGGLGCPSSLYLAAAGVGKITLVDSDVVDITNLQRQVAFTESNVGLSKAQSLKEKLNELNSDISITAVTDDFTDVNATGLLRDVDLVLDCTDNFATRYLINDVCFQHKIPWVMASIAQFSGQCSLFTPDGACFRCVFPESPEGVLNCAEGGVLGVLPGMLAMIQSNEALKYLVGLPTPLKNHVLLVDALEVTQHKIALTKNIHCACCATTGMIDSDISTSDNNLAASYTRHCSVPVLQEFEITIDEFEQLKLNSDVVVIDVRSDEERVAFHVGGEHYSLAQIKSLGETPSTDSLKQLNAELHYVLYCQSGKRSLEALYVLRDRGFARVSSLAGGLSGLLKAESVLNETKTLLNQNHIKMNPVSTSTDAEFKPSTRNRVFGCYRGPERQHRVALVMNILKNYHKDDMKDIAETIVDLLQS